MKFQENNISDHKWYTRIDCTQSSSYSFYKKQVPRKLQVENKKVYLQIINLFLSKVMNKIINKSDEIRLPLNMGNMSVKKIPFNPAQELKVMETAISGDSIPIRYRGYINYKETKKQGKVVLHTNEHSDYARFKFYWEKKKMIIVNKTLYNFKPIRCKKRELAKVIKQGNTDYFNI